MKLFILSFLALVFGLQNAFCQNPELSIPRATGVRWWFGVVNHSHLMPLDTFYHANLLGNIYGNQSQPLLLSSNGDVVWCEEPPELSFTKEQLVIRVNSGKILQHRSGNSLRDAFTLASKEYFPPTSHLPDSSLFLYPQYNTWIELMYNQNQADILQYANAIRDNGFPPGVIMIDDNWQEDYGKWDFHPGRFPDPASMVDSLHQMGFKVMVWVCPFISADSDIFRKLSSEGLLLKDSQQNPSIVRWWNGASALLDFSHPDAVAWFQQQLKYLVSKYGVDGFKFDGGDPEYYIDLISHEQLSPNEHTRLFGQFGLLYPLNEYRAMWKMGGQPLAERLRDKEHSWRDLHKLIPHILLAGLCGYPFTCPDMIGGGEYTSFLNDHTIDQELIVRSAQAHALMPMMQFSVAPWRVLDGNHLIAVKEAVTLRQQYTGYIMELANLAAKTNLPIVRYMEFEYPHLGYEDVRDQFLLGDKILVAPVLEKGIDVRVVQIPPGQWKDTDGAVYQGPIRIQYPVNLYILPYFEKIE